MATSKKIELNGKPVGKLRASWLLVKESLRFLKADSEMLLVPVIAGIMNISLLLLLSAIVFFGFYGGDLSFLQDEARAEEEVSTWFYVLLFFIYVIGAYTYTFSQAAISHTVFTRLHGGNASLGQSMGVAFSHSWSLLVWSVITSTVGIILRFIAERSRLSGNILVALLGLAWSALTYFVVPSIVLDKHSAFGAIKHSESVFKKTWGETLVSNFSIGVIFLLAHILAIVVLLFGGFFGASIFGGWFFMVLLVLYTVWVFASVLIESALAGIVKTLLYVYANEHTVPENFNRELLEKMLSRSQTTAMPPQSFAGTNQPESTSFNQ